MAGGRFFSWPEEGSSGSGGGRRAPTGAASSPSRLPCPTELCEVVATELYTHSFAELGGPGLGAPGLGAPGLGAPGLRAPGLGGPGRAMGPHRGLMAHRWVAGGAQPEIATGRPVRADSWEIGRASGRERVWSGAGAV